MRSPDDEIKRAPRAFFEKSCCGSPPGQCRTRRTNYMSRLSIRKATDAQKSHQLSIAMNELGVGRINSSQGTLAKDFMLRIQYILLLLDITNSDKKQVSQNNFVYKESMYDLLMLLMSMAVFAAVFDVLYFWFDFIGTIMSIFYI